VRSNAKRKESRRILSKSNDRRVSASRDWHDQLAHDRLVSLMRKLETNIKRGFASDRRDCTNQKPEEAVLVSGFWFGCVPVVARKRRPPDQFSVAA